MLSNATRLKGAIASGTAVIPTLLHGSEMLGTKKLQQAKEQERPIMMQPA